MGGIILVKKLHTDTQCQLIDVYLALMPINGQQTHFSEHLSGAQ